MENEPGNERLTLRKGEKLRHRSLVEGLFKNGKTIYEFPLRATYRVISREELCNNFRDAPPREIDSLQMLVTVPKKKRRHAVDRVLMRRRIREAYRLNRLPLKKLLSETSGGVCLEVAFIYLSDRNLPFASVEQKMKIVLGKLASCVSKTTGIRAEAMQNRESAI